MSQGFAPSLSEVLAHHVPHGDIKTAQIYPTKYIDNKLWARVQTAKTGYIKNMLNTISTPTTLGVFNVHEKCVWDLGHDNGVAGCN